jgi:hypothetical protein
MPSIYEQSREDKKGHMFVGNHVRKIHKKREEGLLFSWQRGC